MYFHEMKKIRKVIDLASQSGFRHMLLEIFNWLAKYFTFDRRLQRIKAKISKKFSKSYQSTVQFGPFKNMKFVNNGWGSPEYLGMILGSYEMELQQRLELLGNDIQNFVDVGAASGYYAVGMLIRFPHLRTYAFEISASSSKLCLENAQLNAVANRMQISGEFSGGFISEISGSKNLFLFDIEGAEYELLSSEFIQIEHQSHFMVELHGRDIQKIESLKERFEVSHNVFLLERDYGKILNYLNRLELPQNLTFLIASEGRDVPGCWLIACPRSLGHICNCGGNH